MPRPRCTQTGNALLRCFLPHQKRIQARLRYLRAARDAPPASARTDEHPNLHATGKTSTHPAPGV
eukprot:7203084-Pyramimonas_sp.AAC.1